MIRIINGAIVEKRKQYRKKKLNDALKLRRRYINQLFNNGKIKMSSLKYHSIFLTFFGCGKWKYGPGTLTSFVTVLLWFGVSYWFFAQNTSILLQTIIWLAMSSLMFIYGIFIIPLYAKMIGQEDHPSIVLDEVMGQLVALALSYPFVRPYYFVVPDPTINALIIIAHLGFSFVLFRLLDISKPSIIGKIDRNVKGGLGVMLDDLVSGIITGILNIGLLYVCKHITLAS